MNRVVFAAVSLFLASAQSGAQSVSGVVTNEATGAPVAGALITTYSARGDTTQLTPASSNGRFTVRLPAGREYTILIRSIGLQAVRLNVGPFAAGRDTSVVVQMRPVSITMETIRVEEIAVCTREATGTERVSEIWTEVTNALASTAVGTNLVKRQFDWRVFHREINLRSGMTLLSESNTATKLVEKPFKTATIRDLNTNGFVIRVRERRGVEELVFRAPDETALSDATFIRNHCFWTRTDDVNRPDQIGIEFAPLTSWRLNDIRGTFWLDVKSYELKMLEFRYTQIIGSARRNAPSLPPGVAAGEAPRDSLSPDVAAELTRPGGQIVFQRLPDGLMVIGGWRLWVTDNWPRINAGGLEPLPVPLILAERGGDIVRATAPGSDTTTARPIRPK